MAAYTLDETDLERQRVLAECLNPLTIPILSKVPPAGIRRVLDLGCGQGNTTRLLAAQFPEAEVTGVEYNPTLVEYARSHADNVRVHFEQGDATRLRFADGSYDLVFTRYLLMHLPDPDLTIAEMFRVLRPGGRAVSFEGDCCFDFSYPENEGLRTVTRLFQSMFPSPHVGRQLVHRFRRHAPSHVDAGACLGMEHTGKTYKHIYRLTAQALGPLAVARGILQPEEFENLMDHLDDHHACDHAITVKLPDFWIIATR